MCFYCLFDMQYTGVLLVKKALEINANENAKQMGTSRPGICANVFAKDEHNFNLHESYATNL